MLIRRGEILQVISSLLANSIYAPFAGGNIWVDVRDSETEPPGVVLSVRDNGEGRDRSEALPQVFNAFFTTRATIGTGIGLFVAKQLIEGHGGRISIESSKDVMEHGTNVTDCTCEFDRPEDCVHDNASRAIHREVRRIWTEGEFVSLPPS